MSPAEQKISARDKFGRYIIKIIYEDDDIIVVNKPACLLTIPDHWDKTKQHLHGILTEYLSRTNPLSSAFVVHRLDKDTSGVMVFAKSADAHKNLNFQFENRAVKKKYLAIVSGFPSPAEGEIDAPISKKLIKGGKKVVDFKQGVHSVTKYKLIEKFRDYSIIEAFPQTGRMHQIRVHMAHINCPLAIDTIYSNSNQLGIEICQLKNRIKKNNNDEPHFLIKRLTLHSQEIKFNHPSTNLEMKFSAELPKDFNALIKQLKKWNKI